MGDNHTLALTGFGAPQWHNQRSQYDGLTVEGWQQVRKYMPDGQQYRYNPTLVLERMVNVRLLQKISIINLR